MVQKNPPPRCNLGLGLMIQIWQGPSECGPSNLVVLELAYKEPSKSNKCTVTVWLKNKVLTLTFYTLFEISSKKKVWKCNIIWCGWVVKFSNPKKQIWFRFHTVLYFWAIFLPKCQMNNERICCTQANYNLLLITNRSWILSSL